ncbi:RNA polymerase sigma-70 factor [Terrimonas sp. NA20]|uniref:RNA polymerase sigma-70 factor n=1 Tax=Terrimonas ginsenosidimutans TaxID=2908004 RepID=A0ABS9KLH8_9BACT|nr:RNA polymerase sigma-70 factor [Terrimonas ginsenosidimutans]MCG2613125.1 RNA polymerase sigma-70 factor [Terrimonas ginsenosidimutans]
MPLKRGDIGSLSVQDVWDGNETVFNQLFREHFRALSFFAHSIIGQDLYAQDIVQECFIRVWNRRHVLKDVSELKPYLYTAVKNDCINYLRQQNVRDKKQQQFLDLEKEHTEPSIDTDMIRAESIRELNDRIDQLPDKMREVVRLYYFEGKSSGEIGRLLQKSPDTVQHQRKTALRLLRNLKSFFFC